MSNLTDLLYKAELALARAKEAEKIAIAANERALAIIENSKTTTRCKCCGRTHST